MAAPTAGIGGLFGGMDSLTSLVQLGLMSPAVTAQVAISQAQSNAANVGAEQTDQTVSVSATSADESIVVLAKTGEVIQPYLVSYHGLKALTLLDQGIEGMINQR
ncbi:MAG: hypothetical protein ACI8Z1_001338 [Candidatus Azotimanducaceae bacterium]